MNAAPIGTITTFGVSSKRRHPVVYLEQPDGTLMRSHPILSVISRQRFIKVSHHGNMRKRWRPFSEHVWQQSTGCRIPPGYRLYHRDGDALHDTPENLILSRGTPFTHLLANNPDIAQRQKARQRRAVRRSNSLRHIEQQAAREALLQPDAWYIVLQHLQRILWLPFSAQDKATRCTQQKRLTQWLAHDGLELTGQISILQGCEILNLSRPDGPLEIFRRFIPQRKPSRKSQSDSPDEHLVESLFGD